MTGERPLEGRLVLDLTTALAGPYATLLLAGLGTRVIKIENPARGGDTARGNSPYVTPDGLAAERAGSDDMSVSMLLRGRNKQSMTLNLKSPQGVELFRRLVPEADVVIENYSAGVTARLGIDYESLRSLNPSLVYTSISGFGAQGGPGTGKAMDTIIQALSGVMMTAGEPDDGPVRFGLPIGDLVAPLFAVIGTLAALVEVERGRPGQHVDVSMLGALTSLVACEPFDAFEAMGMPTRSGSAVPRLAPFGLFEASDGWFALCGPTDEFAAGVFSAIGAPQLVDDDRFARRDGRVSNAAELHRLIAEWASARTVAEVTAELDARGVPSAPVRSTADAVRDPLVIDRGEVVRLQHPRAGEVSELYGAGLPILFSASETRLDQPAPALGEHTAAVLDELLGLPDDQVAELRRYGVI